MDSNTVPRRTWASLQQKPSQSSPSDQQAVAPLTKGDLPRRGQRRLFLIVMPMTVPVNSMCIISVIIAVRIMSTVIIIYFLKQRAVKRGWSYRTDDGRGDSCLEEGGCQQTSETHHEHTLAHFQFPSGKIKSKPVRCGRRLSEPIAFPRGTDISGGVSPQQQAVSDKCCGGGLYPGDIVFSATVAFFEGGAGIAGSVALSSGASERDQRTVAVA